MSKKKKKVLRVFAAIIILITCFLLLPPGQRWLNREPASVKLYVFNNDIITLTLEQTKTVSSHLEDTRFYTKWVWLPVKGVSYDLIFEYKNGSKVKYGFNGDNMYIQKLTTFPYIPWLYLCNAEDVGEFRASLESIAFPSLEQ